ncbi:hypothetical protein IX317_002083 [Fusobacterium sp. DD29]|uniref:peptidoglycan editing factor PgeF n=1 Tax=unclassified Fusobacterium TaxID=2648384 RepID=UPI001B8BD53D|nr:MULTISPECIES: peptidoglycan editing factor PgeF [unclassified Fusobacterium]MBR8702321.1 hypothetical protein [Fusobacterium sp. DD45]MBR8712138.1 hypothetical protein [Fusobacterium sp. DD28]MBR8750363.1 hypothetical protein [Fusobacterium sp. DD29]MBR8752716.1 hypothetical protein [Fusobacterium sp. DD26]MBR8762596.1 hypothetical protein [Fusobacterium sp. DD25]
MTDRGNYIQFDELEKYGIFAIYTKKEYGNVMEMKKEKFISDFSFTNKKITAGHQVHSSNIEIIEDDNKLYFENTDGFITKRKDIVIYTKYADCLPIYIYDRKREIISLVHSGWMGTFKEIGINAINIMKEKYSSNPEDIIITFGIGISQDRYEVGEDFLEKFQGKFPSQLISKSFKRENGKLYFDNQKFNYLNLIAHGIKEENINTNNLCTYDGDFHSYRRDREKSGRNGAFICFK